MSAADKAPAAQQAPAPAAEPLTPAGYHPVTPTEPPVGSRVLALYALDGKINAAAVAERRDEHDWHEGWESVRDPHFWAPLPVLAAPRPTATPEQSAEPLTLESLLFAHADGALRASWYGTGREFAADRIDRLTTADRMQIIGDLTAGLPEGEAYAHQDEGSTPYVMATWLLASTTTPGAAVEVRRSRPLTADEAQRLAALPAHRRRCLWLPDLQKVTLPGEAWSPARATERGQAGAISPELLGALGGLTLFAGAALAAFTMPWLLVLVVTLGLIALWLSPLLDLAPGRRPPSIPRAPGGEVRDAMPAGAQRQRQRMTRRERGHMITELGCALDCGAVAILVAAAALPALGVRRRPVATAAGEPCPRSGCQAGRICVAGRCVPEREGPNEGGGSVGGSGSGAGQRVAVVAPGGGGSL